MIYLKKQINKDTLLGIWQVDETNEELLAMLDHKEWLHEVLAAKADARRREMLATRVLLKHLLQQEKRICYFQSGKPYLNDKSYNISISHTKGYVAIVLHKHHTMGLDIEQCTDKIFRVRDRLITPYDYIDPTNERNHLLLHWSAKEAMFKYLNTEGVDFKQDLHVKPFTPKEEGLFTVSESKTSKQQHFDAHYTIQEKFVVVCILEK